MSYEPPERPDYMALPYVNICLFIRPQDLEAAQAAMRALRGGDTRRMLAEALAVASNYSRGYRIEYADEPEWWAAAPEMHLPSVADGRPAAARRSPFVRWREWT